VFRGEVVRALVARAVGAVWGPRRRAPLAIVAAGFLLFVAALAASKIPRPYQYSSALTFSDPAMTMISTMVERGDLWGASARAESSYRLDRPGGLMALRRFSILVLRRGLEEYDGYERCYVTSALAAAGDSGEITQLERIFQSTTSFDLKMAAADGLGDVGDADAVHALERLYDATEPEYKRLLVIGASEAADYGAVGLLSRALAGSDHVTRLTAAKGLAQFDGWRSHRVLRQFMSASRDAFERATAAYALARLGDRSGREVAVATLRGHDDDEARAMAALALGRAGDPVVVPMLQAALRDRNLDVRLAAAVALTHYGEPAGGAYLKAAMRDEDPFTRLHLGQLLDEVAFSKARDVVMAAVASPDPELALQGIHAIGLGGNVGDVRLLVALAEQEADPFARAEAAWALGRVGGGNAVGPLIAMVSDPDHAVRYTAADALDRTVLRLLEGRTSGRI